MAQIDPKEIEEMAFHSRPEFEAWLVKRMMAVQRFPYPDPVLEAEIIYEDILDMEYLDA